MMDASECRLSAASATSASHTEAEDAVDLVHLRRYTLGDAVLEKEVLSLFLGQLPELMTALRSAANERDWKMAAHALKGSGRAVGAWQLANLAEHAEQLPLGGDTTKRQDLFAGIEAAATAARAYIDAAFGPA